jgi:hypothetical protein
MLLLAIEPGTGASGVPAEWRQELQAEEESTLKRQSTLWLRPMLYSPYFLS